MHVQDLPIWDDLHRIGTVALTLVEPTMGVEISVRQRNNAAEKI